MNKNELEDYTIKFNGDGIYGYGEAHCEKHEVIAKNVVTIGDTHYCQLCFIEMLKQNVRPVVMMYYSDKQKET